jgi:hypothetical protein
MSAAILPRKTLRLRPMHANQCGRLSENLRLYGVVDPSSGVSEEPASFGAGCGDLKEERKAGLLRMPFFDWGEEDAPSHSGTWCCGIAIDTE